MKRTASAADTLLGAITNMGITLTSKHNKIKKPGTDKTKPGPNKVSL